MTATQAPTDRPVGRRRIVSSLIVLLVAIAFPILLLRSGGTSSARFGASEEVGPNRLAAATLSIAPGVRTQSFVIDDMAPGDVARGRLDIVNDGDLPLRYALTSEPEPSALADALDMTVWSALTCGDQPPSARSTLLRTTALGAVDQVFGNERPGADPGDRTIDPGDTDTLCWSIELDLNAGNALQGQRAAHTLTAHAEHDLIAQADVEANP